MQDIIVTQEQHLQLIVTMNAQLDTIALNGIMLIVLLLTVTEMPVQLMHVRKKNVVNSLSDVRKIQLDLLQELQRLEIVLIVNQDFIVWQDQILKNHVIEVSIVLQLLLVVLIKLFHDQKVHPTVWLNNII